MQNIQRNTLLDTYSDVIQLSDLLEHRGIVDYAFNVLYKGKGLDDLTDQEIVELINWTLKSLLSLKA